MPSPPTPPHTPPESLPFPSARFLFFFTSETGLATFLFVCRLPPHYTEYIFESPLPWFVLCNWSCFAFSPRCLSFGLSSLDLPPRPSRYLGFIHFVFILPIYLAMIYSIFSPFFRSSFTSLVLLHFFSTVFSVSALVLWARPVAVIFPGLSTPSFLFSFCVLPRSNYLLFLCSEFFLCR